MPDEKTPTNPLVDLIRNIQQLQMGGAQIPVAVTKGDVIVGDVELADGSKLRVRVIVSQVTGVSGITGPGGRPLYAVETAVVPTVMEWAK